MKADISRDIFNPANHHSRVVMQQGRVQLDADWNEQQCIHQYRTETLVRHVIGISGVPRGEDPAGFSITVSGDDELSIATGHLYVDGILCELLLDNANTVDCHTPPSCAPQDFAALGDGDYVVYADVWERHITADDNPAIRETALGGADTTTRMQTVWQVKLEPLAAGSPCPAPGWRPASIHESGLLTVGTVPDGYQGSENQLYRVEIHQGGKLGTDPVSIKWQADNGSIAARIAMVNGYVLTMDAMRKDAVRNFAKTSLVEVIDTTGELAGTPGLMATIRDDVNVANNTITLDVQPPFDPKSNTVLRRWDGRSDVQNATPVSLGNGLEVHLQQDAYYATGDYWYIPVRVNGAGTGEVLCPLNTPLPCHGIKHHYAPLAVVTRQNGKFVGGASKVHDCREVFPPLTALTAGDVAYTNPQLPATTVAEALEILSRDRKGCCTLIVAPGAKWEKVFESMPANRQLSVCFLPGEYRLAKPLALSGLVNGQRAGRVKITGCGAATHIIATTKSALIFSDWEQVSLRDLYVEVTPDIPEPHIPERPSPATAPHSLPRELSGSTPEFTVNELLISNVLFMNCINVDIEHLAIQSRAGGACLGIGNGKLSHAEQVAGTVRVRQTDCRIGEKSLTGMICTNIARVHLEENTIRTFGDASPLTPADIRNDAVLFAQALASLLPKLEPFHGGDEQGRLVIGDGNRRVVVVVEPQLVANWKILLEKAGPPSPGADLHALMAYLDNVTTRLLHEYLANPAMVVRKYGQEIADHIASRLNSICHADISCAAHGITITGEAIRDVKIINNSISRTLQCLVVRGTTSQDTPSGMPVQHLLISGNTLEMLVMPTAPPLYNTEVHHCHRLIAQANFFEVKQHGDAGTPAAAIYTEGVPNRVIANNIKDGYTAEQYNT